MLKGHTNWFGHTCVWLILTSSYASSYYSYDIKAKHLIQNGAIKIYLNLLSLFCSAFL